VTIPVPATYVNTYEPITLYVGEIRYLAVDFSQVDEFLGGDQVTGQATPSIAAVSGQTAPAVTGEGPFTPTGQTVPTAVFVKVDCTSATPYNYYNLSQQVTTSSGATVSAPALQIIVRTP
jgi:hypothetical protein